MRPEFIVELQGRKFVKYAGVLDEAHAQGLSSIQTTLIQAPTDDNGMLAIVSAQVTTTKGVFSGLGDASPANVSRGISPHIIRMAETRAKARALRDAVNVGLTAIEELADYDHDAPNTGARRAPKATPFVLTRMPATGPSLIDRIRAARSEEDLDGLVDEIKEQPAAERPPLQSAWKARRQSLRGESLARAQ